MAVNPGSPAICQVLREDPELGEGIPAARRSRAVRECTAREIFLGSSDPAPSMPEGGIGLLMLDGLMIRRVGIDERYGAELLGEGDLLRPWQRQPDPEMLPLSTRFSVVEPVRLAVLDRDFLQYVSSYPELVCSLVERAIQRTRHLAVNMAIVNQPRVDVRLHMLLWHLAGRWGRVRSDATVVPLRLTHAVLAQLVAARRPTVSTALSDLARRKLVTSQGDEWLLAGEAPGELLDLDQDGGS